MGVKLAKSPARGRHLKKDSHRFIHNVISLLTLNYFLDTAVEQYQRPSIKHPLSNVSTRVGQRVKLECVVIGNPRPEITWMHNGKELSARDVNVSAFCENIARKIGAI